MRRFLEIALLVSAVLSATIGDLRAQTGISPSITFLETDQALPDGLWRINLNGDVFSISKNTAAANNFTTVTTAISIATNGDITIPNDFFVTGSVTITVDATVNGQFVIDFTDAEALLVRIDSDGGDVFLVDTTNDEVEIPTGALILGLGNTVAQDSMIIDATDLTGDGQQDSGAIILTGLAFASATPHDADWKTFVDITSNAGASTWVLQERIDAASYVTYLSVTDTGNFSAPGVGPHAFGAPPSTDVRNYFSGVFVGQGNGTIAHIWVDNTLTGGSGDVDGIFGTLLDSTIRTQTETENIDAMAQLVVGDGNMVDNLTGTIENVANILIPRTPTVGVQNAAIYIGGVASNFAQQTGTYNAIIIDQKNRGTSGQDDSGKIVFTGVSNSGSPHDSDWQMFVDVTSNAGASTWTLQERVDAASYVTYWTIDQDGNQVGAGIRHTFGTTNLSLLFRDHFFGSFTPPNGGVNGVIRSEGTLSLNTGTTSAYAMEIIPVINTSSGTTTIVNLSTGSFADPLITDNLTGGATIENASTLYLQEAPTEASGTGSVNAMLLLGGKEQTGTYDAIVIDQANRSGNGTDDSGKIILTGVSYDGTPHDADWQTFVNVTSNAGASTWTLQSRIDAAGYTDRFTITDAGALTVDSLAVAAINATGDLTILKNSPHILLEDTDTQTGAWIEYKNSNGRLWLVGSGINANGSGDYEIFEYNNNPIGQRFVILHDGGIEIINRDNDDALTIKGHSTQTTSLLRLETSASVGVATIANDGATILGAAGSDGLDEALVELLHVRGGSIEVFDQGTLGSETLTDGGFPDSTNWAGAGEWSDTMSGTTTFTFSSTGNGTLTQTSAQRVTSNEGSNARWYKFTYTTSSVTDAGGLTMTITSAFAASAVTLSTTDGTYSVVFQAHATTADTADFVIDITSASGSDALTLDDVILKEIIGGDIIVAGKITGGGTDGLSIDGDGAVSIPGTLELSGLTGGDGALIMQDANGKLESITVLGLFGGSNFGIGVASPQVRLHVSQAQAGQIELLRLGNNSPNTDRGSFLTFHTDAEMARISGIQEGAVNDEGYLAFSTRQSDVIVEVMRLNGSGNVRIGVEGLDGIDETPPEKFSVVGGNVEVYDSGTLGSETLTDGDMSSTTNWAGATDWSDTISGTTTYTHSAGNGTLTQTASQRVTGNEGSNARWYKFTYTVSSVTDVGANVLTITNAFAASAVTLDISSAATFSVIFQAHATTADTADFVLSATSDTASDTFTLDDLILKEIIGGDIIVAGKLTGGGSNGIAISGGGTVVTFETGLGTVGSTETVDWRDGNHQAATLDENLTFTFIDPNGPGGFTMKLTQDGSGTNTVAWPSSVFWEGGSAPTITATSSAVDLVSFYFDGTNYFGSVLQDMK